MKNGQLLHNGRYQIVSQLGKGGMGAVYLCRDRKLSRRIAIKENNDTRPDSQQQFSQEAVILARLDHPCLPKVLDYFIEPSGKRYLVMEYIEGQDLKSILSERKHPLTEAEALGWISQIMGAAHYLHTWVDPNTGQVTPIVHRDIKPANIQLRADGRVTLIDFGIARLQIGRETVTSAWGTTSPGYSPVEQYSGDSDERADIYALGATLYSLVTRTVPVKSTDRANGKQLTPPRQLNPQLSLNCDLAIQTAMALNAAERYHSVAEMHAALTKFTGEIQMPWRSGSMNETSERPNIQEEIWLPQADDVHPDSTDNMPIMNGDRVTIAQVKPRRWLFSITSLIGLFLLSGLSWLIINSDALNTIGEAMFPDPNSPVILETSVVTPTALPVDTPTQAVATDTLLPLAEATVTPSATATHTVTVTATATRTVTVTRTARPRILHRTPIPTNTLSGRTKLSADQTRSVVTPTLEPPGRY